MFHPDIGHEIQRKDLLGDRVLMVRSDRERAVVMFDGRGDVALHRRADAEQSPGDFRIRVLCQHLVDDGDRQSEIAIGEGHRGLAAKCGVQQRFEGECGVELGFRLGEPAQLLIHPPALGDHGGRVRIDRQRRIQRCQRSVEIAQVHAGHALAEQGRQQPRLQRERAIEALGGLTVAAREHQRHAAIGMGLAIIGL